MNDIALWENEEELLKDKIEVPGLNAINGGLGILLISNQRIACYFPRLELFLQMPHDMITSFKWETGFRQGKHFKITWFENQKSNQVYYKAHKKRQITNILEKMSYYDQPAVLKQWPGQTQQTQEDARNDPLDILKVRYANGEITKQEYEEMKSVLE